MTNILVAHGVSTNSRVQIRAVFWLREILEFGQLELVPATGGILRVALPILSYEERYNEARSETNRVFFKKKINQ